MQPPGLVLAFFGDADAATQAYRALFAAGFHQVAHLAKKTDGKIAVSKAPTRVPAIAVGGAALGAVLGRLVSGGRYVAVAAPAAAALVTSGAAAAVARRFEPGVPDKIIERYKSSLMAGETLLIVAAPNRYLPDAMEILRAGESGPVAFVERPAPFIEKAEKNPLRTDLLSPEKLRELAMAIAAGHRNIAGARDEWLLGRLRQNTRIISDVVRGLNEAARLGQPVSLAAEWLLDNNYILQGQIKDVERNLGSDFYADLPVLKSGRYAGIPRIYLAASELVAASDSRLTREQVLDFMHAYQSVLPLTTGELWAFPLMLRMALVENLRRLTSQLDRRQRERERADFWANRLLSAAVREPDQILPLLAELSREQKEIAPHFADRLVSHLFDEEAALGPVRSWLERKLDAPLSELTGREQRRQAADGVSVANIITSLRFLANLDWRDCFEALSPVDAILGQDPAGVYRSMDFDTRDRYRRQVERLARGARRDEMEVAKMAVSAAATSGLTAIKAAGDNHGEREHRELIYRPAGHVGFYLIDAGRENFEEALGYRKHAWSRFRGWMRDHPDVWYFGGISLGTLAAWGTLFKAARFAGARLPLPVAAFSLIPSSEVAVQIVNYAATRLIPPRPLPKMEFRDGVPDTWKTAVVIPMLLGSVDDALLNAHQLEVHYLSNPDPNLRFALLADYVDGPSRYMETDAERLGAARRAIEDLNARHGGNKFFLFIRDRVWSETEERWMGWERKRGKLEQFNGYLRGRRPETSDVMHPVVGDPAELEGIRFVITLDADTQLPYGAARRLIETLAHPLNRPVLAPTVEREGGADRTLMERGYSIIQPRVDTALPSATATRFSRLFADASGSDPYTHVISDIYQDAFGEASYHGKGIYDLDTFDQILHERFPEATLLSHDLLEGGHVRVGLASDIQLLDTFPPRYLAYAKRQHRWIRGDWQIADWVGWSVPSPTGRSENALSLLNRWKIKDNLRRSLTAPCSMAMLLAGWFSGPGPGLVASIGVAGLLLWPAVIDVFTRLTTSPDSLLRARHAMIRSLEKAAFETALLPYQASVSLDAIGRVLYRRFVSHKLLLEWQTAASTYGSAQIEETSFFMRLALGSALSGIIGLALYAGGSGALPAAIPYLTAWMAAPFAVKWLSKATIPAQALPIDPEDERYLREIARQTWRYFDDFVGPQTNWLPPDNYQEALTVEIAQRTSPTNMGLWLLACVSAHDFGWISLDEVVSRTRATLATFDEMEKFQGHLLNWYNSLTLEPLRPPLRFHRRFRQPPRQSLGPRPLRA